MTESTPTGPVDVTAALERLGRVTLSRHSMESVLQEVSDLAKVVMPGNPEASVSVLVNDKPRTVVHTGQLAVDLDESQYARGRGPCLHAARTGEVTEIADSRTEARWRDHMDRAVERGALSSLSIPLPISEGVVGALNIYARTVDAFDEASRAAATSFAPYAGVAAGNMLAYQSAREMAANIEKAFDARAIIDQAKGMLMERYGLTADQAFQALARVSQQKNRKLRDLADVLVTTGEFPTA